MPLGPLAVHMIQVHIVQGDSGVGIFAVGQVLAHQLQKQLAILLGDVGDGVLLLISSQFVSPTQDFGNEGPHTLDESRG